MFTISSRASFWLQKKVMFRVKGLEKKKKGFKSLEKRGIRAKSVSAINIRDVARLAKDGKEINVIELGYDRVLGGGSISKPLKVTARSFSASAQEKIEKANGQAITA